MNDVNIESVFSLEYVIRRFINIVINSFFEREEFNYVFFVQRFFIVSLLLFSQSNDISLLILKKTLSKILIIIKF